ncbi:MAG: MBOAT family O-acyltransferase [Clostridia bacterium]
MLVCTSFFFYMCWNVKYSLLMLLSILITYFTGILLDKYSQNQKAKRLLLTFGTLTNLFILVYFKYFNFLIDSVNKVFGAEFHFIDVLLPVGISFYTFQAIGYTFDVYFKKINAEKNFINYTLFVSFFPQLVAGPIERSVNMLEQFRTKPRFDISNIKNGGTLILYGLFEKIVVSDRLAIFTDGVFDNYEKMSPLLLILGAVFFSVQIYADFSSYTHIARGSAQLMGYHLMKNFDSPYLAVNIRDFWKRWHISLTSWFTDYLYIPMGGSRISPLRTYFNIAIVFLVSGLWHGANTTFLVWGALHAVAQIVFRMYDKHIGVKLKYIDWIMTYSFICFSYIFFRSKTMQDALVYVGNIFVSKQSLQASISELPLNITELYISIGLVIIMFLLDIARKRIKDVMIWFNSKHIITQSIMYSALMVSIVTIGIYGTKYIEKPFIYFQF